MRKCRFCQAGIDDTATACPHCERSLVPGPGAVWAPEAVTPPALVNTKRCPFCAEEIQGAAIVCKHCGRDLKGGGDATVQKVQIVPRTSPVTWLVAVIATFAFSGVFYNACFGTANSFLQTGSTGSGVSPAQFRQLSDGTTYAEAVRILGSPGTEQSRGNLADIVTVMYAWPGSGTLGANMNAMFQNDRLVTKAQFGLR